MTESRISSTRTIDAPAGAIFDILSNPARHAALDGSGMVQSDSKSDRITAVGQVFTMNMEGDHMGGEYKTDNHVTGEVSVSYDWSAVTDKAILKKLSFPEVSQDALDSTLANLAAQVSEA